jgi:hypothetical protein
VLRTTFIVGVVLLAALSIGCRRRAVAGGAVIVGAPPVSGDAQCTANLAVGVVNAPSTCTIDERVSGQSALLVYPCTGGAAEAAFGQSVFRGSVQNNIVDISIETSFPFSDGCQWRSKQHITGQLGQALQYTYEEQPEPGQSGCTNGCLANATVQTY